VNQVKCLWGRLGIGDVSEDISDGTVVRAHLAAEDESLGLWRQVWKLLLNFPFDLCNRDGLRDHQIESVRLVVHIADHKAHAHRVFALTKLV
jgi:hypothetical protein